MNRLFALCGCVAICSAAFAEEGYSDPTTWQVPGDFDTITDACDAAAPGDIIELVNTNEYDRGSTAYEPFVCNTDGITIVGLDLRQDPAVIEECGDFKVNKKDDQDNTRPNCDELAVVDADLMGGMGSVLGGNGQTVVGVRFINGNADGGGTGEVGGALIVSGDNATIAYCCFENNSADEDGGAIYQSGDNLLVTNSVFRDNEAEEGAGIYVDGFAGNRNLTVVDSDFFDNLAVGSGGAINLFNATGDIEGSCFEGNRAPSGSEGLGKGGAINTFLQSLTIKNSTFCQNRATRGGGAIFNEDSDLEIGFSTFYDNTSLSGGGVEQEDSDSTGSGPDAATNIFNSILVQTRLVNNLRGVVGGNGGADTLMNVFYSFTDQDLSTSPRVRDRCENLGLADLDNYNRGLGRPATVEDMFVDAANCDFRLVCAECYSAPVIDAGDSRYCLDLHFDKDDNGRAIDKVDNPATGSVDEGIPNTGVDIWLRNHTCDAVDMGAFESKQAPAEPIFNTCKGDVDGDNDVDLDDIFEVLRKFGYPCEVETGCIDTVTDEGDMGDHLR